MLAVPNALSQRVARQLLIMRKNSPRTMFVGGLLGMVGSTILACRATMKLEETMNEIEYEVEDVKTASNEDNRKDLAYVYGKSALRLVKLYGPSALLGVASVGALTGSHVTLTRRNVSLMSAYSALSVGFDQYRDRVREELGEKKETELHRGIITETKTENGKTKEVKSVNPNGMSVYARWFDEESPNWTKFPEQNRVFIQVNQNYFNDILHARGHVFLNEVYDHLGIRRSEAGAIVGWVLNADGDNYIDFGLLEVRNSGFINGWERSILLDFNVDGVIFDKIG